MNSLPLTPQARSQLVDGEPGLSVWTDGACLGNPGPGGWAWVTLDGRHDAGAEPLTTNQRMELRAALEALSSLPEADTVVSDSAYVVNCFLQGWWESWKARQWKNSSGKPVANRDLWEPLIELAVARGVKWRWIKGHESDDMNLLADRMARDAARRIARRVSH